MADEAPETVDLWGVLDEAEQTVEGWEAWRREYDADVWSAAAGQPPHSG